VYSNRYWRESKDAPFAYFLGIVDTYLHPESSYDVGDLAKWLRQARPPEKATRFKDELRQLLSGGVSKLPEHALFTAAEFDDGSDEAFLRRLWHELYGDEPVQSGEQVS
jgi:hypothetical protein